MLCRATLPRRCHVGPACSQHLSLKRADVNACRATHSAALRRNSSRSLVPSTLWLTLELIPLQPLLQADALADESATYNVGQQSEVIQALVGVLYLALVAYFFYRVFTGRASRFISGRVGASDKAKPVEEDPYLAEPVAVSPFKAFLSATQALAIAAVLFFFATTLDTAMSTAELPDQYTVRSIAVTLRTIVTGLAYLATFIFAANGVGLAALTVQLAIYGDEEVKPKEEAPQTQESMSNKPNIPNSIPNVGLTSHPEDVMRAFDEVSDLSRYRKDKTQA